MPRRPRPKTAAEKAALEERRERERERRRIRDLRAPRFAEGSPLTYQERAILFSFSPGPVYDVGRPVGVARRSPARETLSRAPRPSPLLPRVGRVPRKMRPALAEAARTAPEPFAAADDLRPRAGVAPAAWTMQLAPPEVSPRLRRQGSASSSMAVRAQSGKGGPPRVRRRQLDSTRAWRPRPKTPPTPRSQQELLSPFATRSASLFSFRCGDAERVAATAAAARIGRDEERASVQAVLASLSSSEGGGIVWEDAEMEAASLPLPGTEGEDDDSWWWSSSSSSGSSRSSSPRKATTTDDSDTDSVVFDPYLDMDTPRSGVGTPRSISGTPGAGGMRRALLDR